MTEEQADGMLKLLIEIRDKRNEIYQAPANDTLVYDAIKDLTAVVEEKLG
jgi:hypothetical protein